MKTFVLYVSLLGGAALTAMENGSKFQLIQYNEDPSYLSTRRLKLERAIVRHNTRKKCLFVTSLLCGANAVKDLFVYSECGRSGFAPVIPYNATSSPTHNSSTINTILTISQSNPVLVNIISFGVNTLCAIGSFGAGLYSWRQEAKAKQELKAMDEYNI